MGYIDLVTTSYLFRKLEMEPWRGFITKHGLFFSAMYE